MENFDTHRIGSKNRFIIKEIAKEILCRKNRSYEYIKLHPRDVQGKQQDF
jgi:hypothetical protein